MAWVLDWYIRYTLHPRTRVPLPYNARDAAEQRYSSPGDCRASSHCGRTSTCYKLQVPAIGHATHQDGPVKAREQSRHGGMANGSSRAVVSHALRPRAGVHVTKRRSRLHVGTDCTEPKPTISSNATTASTHCCRHACAAPKLGWPMALSTPSPVLQAPREPSRITAKAPCIPCRRFPATPLSKQPRCMRNYPLVPSSIFPCQQDHQDCAEHAHR